MDGPPIEAAASGLVIASHVDVWYGGRAVATGVPVGDGSWVAQVDQDVPERLKDVAVPREWQGVTLDPAAGGVLGAMGHRVQLTVTLSTPDGSRTWRQPRGRFLVQDWDRDGASVRVSSGHGLLQVVKDRLRASPYAPGRPSPIAGEVLSILTLCGLDVWLDPRLSTTLRVPADFVQGEDVWKSLMELVTAWPARIRMDGVGRMLLLPGLPGDLPEPDVVWHDGVGGTVVRAPMSGTREGAFSHVVVAVKPEGDAEGFNVEHYTTTGPLAVQSFGVVSQKFDLAAVTTRAQAQSVAVNEAARAGLRAKTLPVEVVPDWRVELDDVAHVRTGAGVRETGRVTGIELPLVSGRGRARVDVGVMV